MVTGYEHDFYHDIHQLRLAVDELVIIFQTMVEKGLVIQKQGDQN